MRASSDTALACHPRALLREQGNEVHDGAHV